MTNLDRLGSFFKAYQATLVGTVFCFIVIFYPSIATRFNPSPASSQMKEVQGKIQFLRADYPHLRLLLENGETTDFAFPGDLQGVYMAEWGRFYYGSSDRFQLMTACQAKVKYDELRYVFVPAPPRIWSVECGRTSISFDEIKREFDKRNEFHGLLTSSKGWLYLIGLFTIFLAFSVENYLSRRKKK